MIKNISPLGALYFEKRAFDAVWYIYIYIYICIYIYKYIIIYIYIYIDVCYYLCIWWECLSFVLVGRRQLGLVFFWSLIVCRLFNISFFFARIYIKKEKSWKTRNQIYLYPIIVKEANISQSLMIVLNKRRRKKFFWLFLSKMSIF